MENMRKGFMTAIVLVMMVVASMLLLVLYQGVANYRENAMSTLSSIQNDADSVNIMNIGVGFLKPKFLGILGIPLLYNDNVPTWFNDFKSKLSQDWQNYITTYVSTTKACKIYDWSSTGGQDSGLIRLENANQFLSEITSYIDQRKPYQISLYAFPMKQSGSTTVFLISMVKRQYRAPNNQYKYVTTYTYCLVGPKLLNQYVYFTNKETGSDDKPIYFTGGELIDGPMRSNDYIYIDNTNGNPTFNGTVEFKGIKDKNQNTVAENKYPNYATMKGNPPYRILSDTDASKLDFNSIASEYQTNLQNMVKPYSDLQTSPATATGIKFGSDITLSFNHDTGSDYDLLIYEGSDVDKSKVRYKIKWKPSGPPNATVIKETKSGSSWSPSAPVDTLFNGVVYSTGNITIDSNNSKYLSKYYGNYTLYSEADIKIKDRLIPYDTYNKYFKNDQAKPLSSSDIESIKKYVSANEKSSLNLVAKNNVIVSEPVVQSFLFIEYYTKLDNMKLFASIYAFNGSFKVADYNNDNPAGQLLVFGSIMQNIRGPVGTFDSSGKTQTGYYKTYVYDERLITAAYQPAGTPAKDSSAKIRVLGVVKSNN